MFLFVPEGMQAYVFKIATVWEQPSIAVLSSFVDYSLTSADLSALQGFTSPGMLSLGQASAWQQHHLGQAALSSLV
jgi:hypothetical protein